MIRLSVQHIRRQRPRASAHTVFWADRRCAEMPIHSPQYPSLPLLSPISTAKSFVASKFFPQARTTSRFLSTIPAATEVDSDGESSPAEGAQKYTLARRAGVRNIAIVAHVDHGKTTLVDKLLWTTSKDHYKTEELNRLMDSGELERERGITITSKVTRLSYLADGKDDIVINVVDTPGHADFSGEVDRILSMVDGVCLLVDAGK